MPRIDKRLIEKIEPLTVRQMGIAEGKLGTEQTLREMTKLAVDGSSNWYLVKIARAIVEEAGIDSRDYEGEAKAVWNWVRANIRFVRDPFGAELIQSPLKTLAEKAGDCDDHSILNAALLGAIGFPVRFVVIKRGGTEFVHVFVDVWLTGLGWTAFDTAAGPSSFGWRPGSSEERQWEFDDMRLSLGDGGARLSGWTDGSSASVMPFNRTLGEGFDWGGLITAIGTVGATIYGMKIQQSALKDQAKQLAQQKAQEQAAIQAQYDAQVRIAQAQAEAAAAGGGEGLSKTFMGIPLTYWLIGGGVLAVGGFFLLRKRRGKK